MIKTLFIRNFILIDELFLEFNKGFNVFLGETGAGKSIILKAIDVALGTKTNKDVVKDANKTALVEVVFENKSGVETTISREISQTGTKCRMDGALVNLDAIKEIRDTLIDIHSQHQTYTYMQPKHHMGLLDAYTGATHSDFSGLLDTHRSTYNEYKEIASRLNKIKESNSANLDRIEFLKFQIDEIERAEIAENEEATLNNELEVLANVQTLKELSYGAYWTLNGESTSIIDTLNKIKYSISKAAEMDNAVKEPESAFLDALETLRDVSNTLRSYNENLSDNPERLNYINDRLEIIEKLKRKYGNVFEAYDKFAKELSEIECDSNSIIELEARAELLLNEAKESSQKLSELRKSQAKELSDDIIEELKKLELAHSSFEISITPKGMNANGIDEVEFLITTNISQPLMPLIKVASGGEISRVMLAIKTIFAKVDSVGTVIFDEIDTGISGKASVAVANSIQELSKSTQIFSVTHQPIIAAKADQYFWVAKSQDGETQITVEKLSEDEKPNALAQLASGDTSSDSVTFAKKLLSIEN